MGRPSFWDWISRSNALASWVERVWRFVVAALANPWVAGLMWTLITAGLAVVQALWAYLPWWYVSITAVFAAILVAQMFVAFRRAVAVRGLTTIDVRQIGKECLAFRRDALEFLVERVDEAPGRGSSKPSEVTSETRRHGPRSRQIGGARVRSGAGTATGSARGSGQTQSSKSNNKPFKQRKSASGTIACYPIRIFPDEPLVPHTISLPDGHVISDDHARLNIDFGLDHNESRSWHGWHRHVSLVMLAFTMLATIRHHANQPAASKTMLSPTHARPALSAGRSRKSAASPPASRNNVSARLTSSHGHSGGGHTKPLPNAHI